MFRRDVVHVGFTLVGLLLVLAIIGVLVAMLPGVCNGSVAASQDRGSPKDAKTTADILKWVESAKKCGIVSTIEFRSGDTQWFIVWYNPYSGRAACHLHGYTFNAEKNRWERHLDRVFEGTPDVSVEVSGTLITIRDTKGVVIESIGW